MKKKKEFLKMRRSLKYWQEWGCCLGAGVMAGVIDTLLALSQVLSVDGILSSGVYFRPKENLENF